MRTLLSAFLMATVAVASAAQENLADLPGYFEFDPAAVFGEGASSFEIRLEGPLLSMMANATKNKEPDLAELLNNLKLVRVHIAPMATGDSDSVAANMNSLIERLETSGWSRVMKMREPDGRQALDAFMKMKGEKVEGFTLFVLGGGDALGSGEHGPEGVFINIVGEIDPEKLGALAAKFIGDDIEMDWLDELGKEHAKPESPLEAARKALEEARAVATVTEATATAAEMLAKEAEQLAADGQEEVAARLLTSAAALYRGN
jgi:hypothetical protein